MRSQLSKNIHIHVFINLNVYYCFTNTCIYYSSHNWNTLFLGANAVANVMAEKYGTQKSHILDAVSTCTCMTVDKPL